MTRALELWTALALSLPAALVVPLLPATASSDVGAPGNEQPGQSILRQYARRAGVAGRYANYAPHFQIAEFEPGKWWILDGQVRVAMLSKQDDIVLHTNYDPDHPNRAVTLPKILHAPTLPGDQISIVKFGLPLPDQHDIAFSVSETQVVARVTAQWTNGTTRTKILTFLVDDDFGYIIHFDDEFHAAAPGIQEFSNFLARGTTDDRPQFKRYSYLLWLSPSGQIMRWNQNNLSCVLCPGGDADHAQRSIQPGGFHGYFGEKDRNPALEILAASPLPRAETCLNVLDEHMVWSAVAPASHPRDANGRFIYRAVFNSVSLPPTVCDLLTHDAVMVDLLKGTRPPALWAFTTGQVTDFEAKYDPSASYRGVFFTADESRGTAIVVAEMPHSGTNSLRITVDGQERSATPWGGSLHVTEGQRYRLTAWVKTDLADGAASLHADECLFTYNNITAAHRSASVHGRSDWQELSLDFTPGEKAHVVRVGFYVSGHGRAWLDDVLLMPVPASQ